MDLNARKFRTILLTVGYSGYAPVAKGSCGTFAAVLIVWLISLGNDQILAPVSGVFLCLAILISGSLMAEVAVRNGELGDGEDPQRIVLDELLGYFVALIALPLNALNMFLAFVFFRLFDIIKPPPVSNAENLPGGWGIMADDLVAGIIANLCVRLVLLIL